MEKFCANFMQSIFLRKNRIYLPMEGFNVKKITFNLCVNKMPWSCLVFSHIFLPEQLWFLSNKASTYKYDQIKILHIRSGCQDTKKRGEKWQWHHAGKDEHLAKLNQNITESDRKEWETDKWQSHLSDLAAAGRKMFSELVNTQPCLQKHLEKILPAKNIQF